MDASEDQEDRDHEATEKKIKDALERGDAPVSHDLTLLGTLLSIYAFLKSISHFISSDHVGGMALLLEGASRFRIVNGADTVRFASSVAGVVSQPVLAAVAIALAVSTAVGAAPQRPNIVRRRVRIDPTRLDPAKGVDRLFGRKALATFGKVILKAAC